MSDTSLAPITRPNGKPYRPRKITCNAVSGELGEVVAVIVLGTHDVDGVRQFAQDSARYWAGSWVSVIAPGTGWWRDAICNGERTWAIDDVRGRAGVWFDVTEGTASE